MFPDVYIIQTTYKIALLFINSGFMIRTNQVDLFYKYFSSRKNIFFQSLS